MYYYDTLDDLTVQHLIAGFLGRGTIDAGYREPLWEQKARLDVCKRIRAQRWDVLSRDLPWCQIRADWYERGVKCRIPRWAAEKLSRLGFDMWVLDCMYHSSLYIGNWVTNDSDYLIAQINSRLGIPVRRNKAGRLYVPRWAQRYTEGRPEMHWVPSELAVLRANRHLSLEELHNLLPTRTLSGIRQKRARL